jgi:predicted ribosome quality control (RQC) complex YloA/Tae2 family protein
MNLEGIALYALTDYLEREITGSRIYKIGMPSAHVVYFSLKREHDTIHLIMDVSGGSPSVRLVTSAPNNPQEPPAFCMLLRKHLEEGKITRVSQYGLDRVIELEISLLGRTGRIITKHIIIELTGKNANLIFAEGGKILDSIKHVSPLMNSVRVVQPG